MVHELKTWPEYFQSMLIGQKSFELRKNDRGFKIGQALKLLEFNDKTKEYTGRVLLRRITYVLQGKEAEEFGLKEGYCVMSLAELKV